MRASFRMSFVRNRKFSPKYSLALRSYLAYLIKRQECKKGPDAPLITMRLVLLRYRVCMRFVKRFDQDIF